MRTLSDTFGTRISAVRSRFSGWQYAQLAVLFPLFLLLLPFLNHALLVKAVVSFLLLNIMLVGDSALPAARFIRPIGWALWMMSTLGLLVEDLHVHDTFAMQCKLFGIGAHSLLIGMCTATILSVVFRDKRVTVDGIFASVVAYQLLGFLFAQIYTMLYLANPTSLRLPDTVTPTSHPVQLDMIYFSFVTLATLGYGDIVPATPFARSIAIVEAMAGQFYVAVVVAVLVSAFVAQRLTAPVENDPR
ncbi:MAG: ion channel [Nitrococcus sp.]|nr:ion channel [Nitrococcus sp.]